MLWRLRRDAPNPADVVDEQARIQAALLYPNRYPSSGAWLALSAAMALPVGFARRWPLPVLGLTLAGATAVTLAQLRPLPWPPFVATADALILYLAATRSRPLAGVAAAGTVLAQLAALQLVSDAWQPGLVRGAPFAFATVIAWLAGDAVRQRREYGEALREQAVTGERLRIARELHDLIAHSIGVIAIQAGAASLVLDSQPAGARRALHTIETTSRETLAGLRRMLGVLRRADGDSAEAGPTVGLEAVDRLAETTAEAGVLVEVRWLGRRRPLSPEVDLAAFRIIQESVTNAVRHSGADRCLVAVEYRDEELAIEVVDDGRGGGARSGGSVGAGHGITGMRERVALLGGRFAAGSRAEGGFLVEARLPA
ncbi:sensor histidine kinase [Solihabitans fulvus]|uniref:histidine kinase n=2 Tax=Solihabitans fulvus TaxID=1892852 RepID=A0A5B2XGZ3_9PSEU|nr:sensor histidine kinase [Solihabitans fulvus]